MVLVLFMLFVLTLSSFIIVSALSISLVKGNSGFPMDLFGTRSVNESNGSCVSGKVRLFLRGNFMVMLLLLLNPTISEEDNFVG